MTQQKKLLPMAHSFVEKAVDIHLRAFQGFFLSYLGKNFLEEFYEGVIEDPTGIAYVVTDNQALVGFVAGSSRPKGFFGRLLKKRWFKFGFAALPALLSNPRIFPRLLRAVSMPNQELPHPNCGTLLSIAVDPERQGGGVGTMLVDAFLAESKARGLDAVNLTTDAVDNDKVNFFYEKMGFSLHRNYMTPEGRSMNEYIYYLENFETN